MACFSALCGLRGCGSFHALMMSYHCSPSPFPPPPVLGGGEGLYVPSVGSTEFSPRVQNSVDSTEFSPLVQNSVDYDSSRVSLFN